jgi:hypothetical protein
MASPTPDSADDNQNTNVSAEPEQSPTLKTIIDKLSKGEPVADLLMKDSTISELKVTRQVERALEVLYLSEALPKSESESASYIGKFERDLPTVLKKLSGNSDLKGLFTGWESLTIADTVSLVKVALALWKGESPLAVGIVFVLLLGVIYGFAKIVTMLNISLCTFAFLFFLISPVIAAILYDIKIHRDTEDWPSKGGTFRTRVRNGVEKIVGYQITQGVIREMVIAFCLIVSFYCIYYISNWVGYPEVGGWLVLGIYAVYLFHGVYGLSKQICFAIRMIRTDFGKMLKISPKGVLARAYEMVGPLAMYTGLGGYLKVHFLIELLKTYGLE